MRHAARLVALLWAIVVLRAGPVALASADASPWARAVSGCAEMDLVRAPPPVATAAAWTALLDAPDPGADAAPVCVHRGLSGGRPLGRPTPFSLWPPCPAGASGGGAGEPWCVEDAPGRADHAPPTPRRPGRDWAGLGRDTAFVLGYQSVVIGALLLLPESVSQWTTAQKHPSVHTWWTNVQQPVWDQDTWAVNYLGHPYFGALYYLRARARGLGVFEAFWYTAVLSTLYEFGVEAFFERPSYQDLLVTPVGGVLLGAVLFEPLRERLQGKPVLRWYDQLALTLTDPLGAANRVVERALGLQAEVRVQVRPLALAPPAPGAARPARTPTRPEGRHLRPPGVSIEVRVAGRRPGPARQGKA